MRKFAIKPKLNDKLIRVFKKDKLMYERILKKIEDILNSKDIEHYKNLRNKMKDSKRVQIGHFVLVFSYDKSKDFVSFEDFAHHDYIYK